MLLSLSGEQRQAIATEGTPLPLIDSTTGQPYLLISVHMSGLPDGSISAAIPELGLWGEGSAPEEAILALAEVAKSLCEH